MRILQIASPSTDEQMLMVACLNSARRHAEKMIDFELSKKRVYLTIDATDGGDIDTAEDGWSGTAPNGELVFTKKIRRIERFDTTNSVWTPASLMSYDYYRQQGENVGRSVNDSTLWTRPTDYPDTVFPTRYVYLREGGYIFSSDESSTAVDTNIRMYVYAWLTEYQDALHSESGQVLATILAQTDFLVKHCDSYLTWWAVREFNSRSANFVPRNEGSLDPGYIDARVNESWDAMVAWDADLKATQNYLGAQ